MEKVRQFRWPFCYRTYLSQRAIQIKPSHDKTNHFSIIWTKEKKNIKPEQFEVMDKGIREYLATHNNKLTFRVIVACKNCTYGRFNKEFEDLIMTYRNQNSAVFRGKDLTLGLNNEHEPLKLVEDWTDANPIMFHIHGRSNTGDEEIDSEWFDMMHSPRNSLVELDISVDDPLAEKETEPTKK